VPDTAAACGAAARAGVVGAEAKAGAEAATDRHSYSRCSAPRTCRAYASSSPCWYRAVQRSASISRCCAATSAAEGGDWGVKNEAPAEPPPRPRGVPLLPAPLPGVAPPAPSSAAVRCGAGAAAAVWEGPVAPPPPAKSPSSSSKGGTVVAAAAAARQLMGDSGSRPPDRSDLAGPTGALRAGEPIARASRGSRRRPGGGDAAAAAGLPAPRRRAA
jgi:hypothetical protein